MKKLLPKFRTGFRTEEDRKFSVSGTGFEVTFRPVMNDDGECDVVVDSKIDFYAMIQSHKDGTDLHTMIARYENGDVNALNRTNGMFADLTTAPKSLIDFHNKITSAEEVFHRLPLDIQREFDNNALKFWSQIDTGKVADVITKYNFGKSEKKKISTEVIQNLGGAGAPVAPVVDTPKDGVA